MLSFKVFTEKIQEEPTILEGYVRFRRSVNILPGVRANITSKGLSGVSAGSGTHRVTLNSRGLRHSFKLGKGVSFIAAATGRKTSGIVKPHKWKMFKGVKFRPAKNVK